MRVVVTAVLAMIARRHGHLKLLRTVMVQAVFVGLVGATAGLTLAVEEVVFVILGPLVQVVAV